MPYKDRERQKLYQSEHYQNNKDTYRARAGMAIPLIRARNQEYINGKKSVPCMDCGKTYPPYVMHFDHVRGEKISNVSTMVNAGLSLETIQEEIDKCEVVCANCHAIRTWERKMEGSE